MNFEDERFVKIYPRNTTNWKLLGWEGRCVLMMLLREVDRAGCLDLEGGMEGLALLLDLPPDVTERGFSACVKRGSVVQNGNTAIIPNFVKAQEARQTDRVRQAESRARRRELGMMSQNVTNETRTVTKRDEMSHRVTPSHTESHAVTLRIEQTRPDQNKTDSDVPSEPSQPGLKLEPQSPADHKKPSAAQVRDQTALILFAELNQARLSVVGGSRAMEPRTAALAGLKACLAQGYTPDEIRRVIQLKIKECRTDPSQAKWFTPTWFRPGNVERYLALRPQDVTSARPSAGYGRNPKPESDLEKLGRHFRERREARERGDVIDMQSSRMLDGRRDDE